MDVRINSVGFSASTQLEDFITKKLSKLEKYNDGLLAVEVILKLEKDDHLENKVAEVRAMVKGNDAFVKKNARTFEEAVDNIYDVMKIQLVKIKEKERQEESLRD